MSGARRSTPFPCHGPTPLVLVLALVLPLVLLTVPAHGYNNGAIARKPPMGWNTWCTDDLCGLVDKCSEKLARSVADSIVEQGLDKLGYKFVNLDDCWSAKTRDANGHLQPDPDRFPSGMKALADYVHSKGLYLGVYTCVGTVTCKHDLPGSAGHWEADATTLAGWGVDFIKADFCTADHSVPARTLYQNFSHAINATGREILFSLCEWGLQNVSQWGADVGQMFRIQMDHLPFFRYKGAPASGAGFGQGTWSIIEYVATVHPSTFVKPYGWMDPDFLETLFVTMDFTASRTEMTFWCLWSAPLLVATDIRKMSEKKKSILLNEEVIAIDQDDLATAGERIKFDNTTGAQVWFKPLAGGDGVVVLYNSALRGDPIDVSVEWTELPKTWPEVAGPVALYPGNGTSGVVRDLWNKTDLGTFATGVSMPVAPRDVRFLRVKWVS